MGAESTCRITREDAVGAVREALSNATDSEVERALEALVGDKKLLNFLIVRDYGDVEPGQQFWSRGFNSVITMTAENRHCRYCGESQ